MTELEKVDMCMKYLIKSLCLDTNATTAEYTVHGLTEADKQHGTWKITITRESPA